MPAPPVSPARGQIGARGSAFARSAWASGGQLCSCHVLPASEEEWCFLLFLLGCSSHTNSSSRTPSSVFNSHSWARSTHRPADWGAGPLGPLWLTLKRKEGHWGRTVSKLGGGGARAHPGAWEACQCYSIAPFLFSPPTLLPESWGAGMSRAGWILEEIYMGEGSSHLAGLKRGDRPQHRERPDTVLTYTEMLNRGGKKRGMAIFWPLWIEKWVRTWFLQFSSCQSRSVRDLPR